MIDNAIRQKAEEDIAALHSEIDYLLRWRFRGFVIGLVVSSLVLAGAAVCTWKRK